jgi:hypothetical protein
VVPAQGTLACGIASVIDVQDVDLFAVIVHCRMQAW